MPPNRLTSLNRPAIVRCTLAWFTLSILGAAAQFGPPASPETVAAAAAAGPPLVKGPFVATWDSIRANYRVPGWFVDAKFGIMLHWGLYAVPAHASEWYCKHMYGNPGITAWHTEHFGPPDKFGYKDFIPKFTCEKFDPDAWAELFKKAGARYVVPTAEHHDGFALWDSALTKWNAKTMGPKRDLIGDLGKAVRKQGLKFGVSNHRIEHFTFINPTKGLKTDLDDPACADFYSVSERSPAACERFLADWVARNFELIDQYQPDLIYFDNGVNARLYDPLKLKVAAYYYNRAAERGEAVSLCTKSDAYLAGSIRDFERQSRAPKELTEFVWQVDEPVLYRWGYTEGSPIATARSVVHKLVDNVSKNGSLLLNVSPKADGTIPQDQQDLLWQIGRWLEVNGEAIYGTRPWSHFGEGGGGAQPFRFTTRGDILYAISLTWPGDQATIRSLAQNKAPAGKIESVTLLGHKGALEFAQDETGLKVRLPAEKPCDYAFALKITGLTSVSGTNAPPPHAAETKPIDAQPAFWQAATRPPMGWNSWDCFATTVTEDQTKAQADYMADHLARLGWQYIVVDIQWYEPQAKGFDYRPNAKLVLDEWGRLWPATNRFPSAANGVGFKALADYVHGRGLKFGVHLLRGIPRQAVAQNTPIKGASHHAADIADPKSTCSWNTDMYGLDMTKPGAQEYYDSVFELFAAWDIDFVKVDDISRPYHRAEVEAISKAIDHSGRSMVLSLSPGETPLSEGAHVSRHANMWRISDDFWDQWPTLLEQFERLDKWTPFRGPGHFPDADMLPLGVVGMGRRTRFTRDEQYTLVTLWSIARSPLIFGGDLTKMDEFTFSLLSNEEVLAVDQDSAGNQPLFNESGLVAWTAEVPNAKAMYLALFNTRNKAAGAQAEAGTNVPVKLADLGFRGPCRIRDLWSRTELGEFSGEFAPVINWHGAGLYRISAADSASESRLPILFLIGDSTVNNPTKGLQGWGTPIADLFDKTRITVQNRARGGRSSRTYFTEGLWDQVLAAIKPGDFVLMQFGHNDGGPLTEGRARASLKGTGDETREVDNQTTGKHEAVHTYGWYLRKYVTDTKTKGATPIVLSLVPRNIWKGGKVARASNDYGRWAEAAAKTEGAFFINLNEIVAKHYEDAGQPKVQSACFTPTDHTHTTPAGAQLSAASLVEGLRALSNCPLTAYLRPQPSEAKQP